MTHEQFRADITNTTDGAHDAGMATKDVARLLRQVLYTVDMVARWDKPTLTTARPWPKRAAQCL